MKIVYWITKFLGTKAVNEELKPEEYGSIIYDVRHLKDGENELVPLRNTIQTVAGLCTYCSKFGMKLIIQCDAGISRSNMLAVVMLVAQVDMELQDAIDFVKKKCPRMQINQDMLDQLKLIYK